jgi:hypothetical protein
MRGPSVVWVGPCCWNDNIWHVDCSSTATICDCKAPSYQKFVIVKLPLLHVSLLTPAPHRTAPHLSWLRRLLPRAVPWERFIICSSLLVPQDRGGRSLNRRCHGDLHDPHRLLYVPLPILAQLLAFLVNS